MVGVGLCLGGAAMVLSARRVLRGHLLPVFLQPIPDESHAALGFGLIWGAVVLAIGVETPAVLAVCPLLTLLGGIYAVVAMFMPGPREYHRRYDM